jgi:hypothetical protein
MKFLCFFTCILFFVMGCKKENGADTCRLEEARMVIDGSVVYSAHYEYDNQGRITKINKAGYTGLFQYYSDSVVEISPTNDYRLTYFINSAGRADSAKLRLLSDPADVKLNYQYSYDPNGFLVREQKVSVGFINGNILRDTTIYNYTVQNGNITKATNTRSPTENNQLYEYSNYPAPDNNPELNIMFPSALGAFLGKKPANLISKITDEAGAENITFSYSFNVAGNVSKQTSVDHAPWGKTAINEFEYHCN